MAKSGKKSDGYRGGEEEAWGRDGRDRRDLRGRSRADDEWASSDADDERDRRIAAIVGAQGEVPPVEALDRFHAHLVKNLTLPCLLTSHDEFDWEEPYLRGDASKREYGPLKKTQPSHEDEFELVTLLTDAKNAWSMGGAWERSLVARTRRIADGAQFDLPLAELRVVGGRARNHQLVHDYHDWFNERFAPSMEKG